MFEAHRLSEIDRVASSGDGDFELAQFAPMTRSEPFGDHRATEGGATMPRITRREEHNTNRHS